MPLSRHALATILALATVLTSAPPAPAVETELLDGIPHVMNGSEPRDGIRHVHLEELWRAGGEEDEIIFGLVTRVRQDEDRNLYVMDAQLSQVHVYDETGSHLRTLFGEGEGPGEVRGPRDLVLLSDGRVGAVQEMPGKLIFVDRDNSPAGNLRVGGAGVEHGGFCQTFTAHAGQEILLLAGFLQAPGSQPGHMDQTSFLASFDGQGQEIHRFCADTHDLDLGDFTFQESKHLAGYWWTADVGPGDRVYIATSLDRYEIQVCRPDGALERVIEREYTQWPRSAAEKQHFVEMVKAIYGGSPIDVDVRPSDHEPVVLYLQRGLRVHPDGSIWVLTTRSVREQAAGVMATFDVFDSTGEFVSQVAVHHEADGRRDGIFFLGDDRAVVIKGYSDAMLVQFTGGRMSIDLGDDEAGAMEVIYCRVRDEVRE